MIRNPLRPASLVLAGILCISAPVLAQSPAGTNAAAAPENRKAAPGDHYWHHEGQRRFEDMARLLALTPEQRAKARQIFENAWNQSRQIMPQMREEEQQIRSLFQNSSAARFDAQVDLLATREGQLYADLIRVHTKAMKEFYSTLTPDQKTKAQALYDLLTTRSPFEMQFPPAHLGMRRGPTE